MYAIIFKTINRFSKERYAISLNAVSSHFNLYKCLTKNNEIGQIPTLPNESPRFHEEDLYLFASHREAISKLKENFEVRKIDRAGTNIYMIAKDIFKVWNN